MSRAIFSRKRVKLKKLLGIRARLALLGLILVTLRLRHYRARVEAKSTAPPAPARPVVTPGAARKVA